METICRDPPVVARGQLQTNNGLPLEGNLNLVDRSPTDTAHSPLHRRHEAWHVNVSIFNDTGLFIEHDDEENDGVSIAATLGASIARSRMYCATTAHGG